MKCGGNQDVEICDYRSGRRRTEHGRHSHQQGLYRKLYDIDKEKIHRLQELKTIKVTGVIACEAAPAVITDRIDEVMDDVDVIMVVSTTDAIEASPMPASPI